MSIRILSSTAIVSLLFISSISFAAPRGDFVELVKKLSPTVVDVSASGIARKNNAPNLPPNHPFRKFFEDRNDKKSPQPRARSLGSGFIIDSKGIVVTNHHVVKGATAIQISLSDGRKYDAKLIGSDQYSDIAVLQIKNKGRLNLPAVKFGDPKKVQVGEWVFAIGTPFGLKGTVTAGIVSAINRDINAGAYDDFIQTDAAINKGNSGGPLFNTRGEVIGINTIIVSPSGGSAGAGFAIPVSTALPVINQLLRSGETSRGWLGVQIQQINDNLAQALGLDSTKGALVAEVLKGSPSEKAGIKQGDIITKFNGKEVIKMRDLPRFVAGTKVGTLADVEVIRNGRKLMLKVLLGRLEEAMAKRNPTKPSVRPAEAEYGLVLKKLTPANRKSSNIPDEVKGVLVSKVEQDSAAAASGLRAGSIIIKIDKRRVREPKDVIRVLDRAKRNKKKAILVLYWFNGSQGFLPLTIE